MPIKTLLFALLFISIIATQAVAQTDTISYQLPDTEPQFVQGGEGGLASYIVNNLTYPKNVLENNIKGTVILYFTVDTLGNVWDIEIAKPIGGGCDERAIQLLKNMPKWQPAIKNGKPVNAHREICITFLKSTPTESQIDTLTTYYYPDKEPLVLGTTQTVNEYIAAHIAYPLLEKEHGITSNLIISYTVTKKGKIGDLIFNSDSNTSFAQATKTVFAALPPVEPGKVNGDAVTVKVEHVVDFKLLDAQTKRYVKEDYYNYGVILFEKGDYRNALNAFSSAIQSDTLDTMAYYNRGICSYKLLDSTSACYDWYRAKKYGMADAENLIITYCGAIDCSKPQYDNLELPQFPGGDEGLFKFIRDNVKYPNNARENQISGTVYIDFKVNKYGYVSDVRSRNFISGELNSEAKRVVRLMPRYKPGIKNGKIETCQFTIPISFNLW